jgi:hypothetical protein
MCATLPKLTTEAFGKFIPNEVYAIMGCSKPAQTGLRTTPMLGSSSTCSSWASQVGCCVTTLGEPAVLHSVHTLAWCAATLASIIMTRDLPPPVWSLTVNP